MRYEFDVADDRIKRRSVYEYECELMQQIVDGKHNNLCFEYNDEYEAKSAYISIRRRAKINNIPVALKRNKNLVIVVRA